MHEDSKETEDRLNCSPSSMPSNRQTLVAEGRNLTGIWDFGDIVDLNVLSSNDIGAVMDTYGVEAGRACIIREINSIFEMYIST
jgi:RNA polymerase Rpb1, domain 5